MVADICPKCGERLIGSTGEYTFTCPACPYPYKKKESECTHENMEMYAFYYSYSMYPTDAEQAGYCPDCGFDTHKDVGGWNNGI
ncbi:small zinc finger protein-like protein [Enterococcus phage GVEsP-1]|uniref:Uncharacterized protein n=3 Tax=Schiekvirus TaxID=2732968 RepID=A0AAE9KRW5_9CAUD|nr:hypothetical protein HOU42_gp022 [Enterococcus phage EfV12-phi1]AYJ73385.1 hypothetical protein EFV12PHI1_1 [Enterococcus phage EfV12-phi1]QYS24523.1 small zinc finger protein-like protein [Enterococcus phage GVEsP-1]UPW35256.1 hypothetical protein KEBGJNKE_00017 [Enterococcus phage vB_OCPT_Bop]